MNRRRKKREKFMPIFFTLTYIRANQQQNKRKEETNDR